MPSVIYNGQSFAIDARRLWILGAAMQCTRIPRELWPDRIADARQAGCNTIQTACPWCAHEPRRNRFDFEGQADVKAFIECCAEQKMRVVLRPGPFVGGGFDGGGLPGWLLEEPGVRLREASEAYLDRVGRYFRRLLGELVDLMATKGGPIILVQVEHDWTCANDAEARAYLGELSRMIRESGVTVPQINANNLWTDPVGTIDTWRGDDELLANLRQFRSVRPDAPRLVSAFEAGSIQSWGQPINERPDPEGQLRRLAEILAAGAQPIIAPFHGGTNFGFLGGRQPGPAGGGVTTAAAVAAPVGEAGERSEGYQQMRRLLTFANHFAHVFGDLDPDYQPVTLDPRETVDATGATRRRGRRTSERGCAAVSIIPLRGAGGRVVFVLTDGSVRSTMLLLDNGVHLPIDLGNQPVGWYVLSVDLNGSGRLDYANLCPMAIVDRALVVLQGPAKTDAILSVNGTPLQTTVPSGSKPLLIEHKGVVFVICNQKQIDATYVDERAVYVGVSGFDIDGRPRPAEGWTKSYRIGREGVLETISFSDEVDSDTGARTRRTRRSMKLSDWQYASAEAHATGRSPRYASLAGPESLALCGAPTGYGWYRLTFSVGSTKKRLIHAPQAGERVQFFLDGEPTALLGNGPGAEPGPVELRLDKGEQVLAALVDNFGRFCDGNDLEHRVGLFGHLYEVKTLRTTKPKEVQSEPVEPFELRRFIMAGAVGRLTSDRQIEWGFTYQRNAPVILDVAGARTRGVFVLNDIPIAYYAGETGASRMRLVLMPRELDAFKRGKNVLRFAAELNQEPAAKDIISATTIYECVETLTDSAAWSFAKWERPSPTAFASMSGPADRPPRGMPCWWRCEFSTPDLADAAWFDTSGLSKGHVFLNGRNLGRYFTATATSKSVGPQTRLFLPDPWLNGDEPNELLVFDEHGFAPDRTRLVGSRTGDLD
jgi:hypothetical protein